MFHAKIVIMDIRTLLNHNRLVNLETQMGSLKFLQKLLAFRSTTDAALQQELLKEYHLLTKDPE